MSRRCTICQHTHRLAIESALIDRMSYRKIAARYGVGYRSVGRHMLCLRRAIQAVQRAQESRRIASQMRRDLLEALRNEA